MTKYVLTFFLLVTAVFAMAQQKSVVHLIQSESMQGAKINGVDVLKVYKGVFQQDNSTLSSDSAYFHQKENTFDAFGHVVITQGDTLHIYSDKLNYNGNTKIAILTDHVRMVDKDATLTTDYLTYNTATKIGTYTGGGKLINKDNTLTSKNGYYFASTRDSYFRYNVLLLTPDAIIKTDTLRYNSGSRIAYFYGPTNIYGKKKGKDNDTLYTENGTYNTKTEQAFFGKNNLYRQGTKTLTGDSLFYDRKKGYGRAINHIIFNDTEQKMTLKGNLGVYYKDDQRTVVTQNAYAVLVTEEKDTTKNDSLAKTGKDTVSQSIGKDTVKTAAKEKHPPTVSKGDKKQETTPEKKKKKNKKDKTPEMAPVADSTVTRKDTTRLKHDSIFMTADTLETRILTYKDLKDLQEKIRLAHTIDTTVHAASIVYTKPVKYIDLSPPKWIPDTAHNHYNMFGHPKPKEVVPKQPEKPKLATVEVKQDTVKKKNNVTDSAYMTKKVTLSDTSRIRILSAFHHVKMFKSDLQGKSDSAFYSASDSTIRLYYNPIVWTQGSQLTGDTIYLQLKNKKLDNMDLFPNAFIVNVEKNDSTNFNQAAGKKMRGFFKDGKLVRMFVDGNAETIYFSRDSTGKITGMQRSLSRSIAIGFKDNKVTTLDFSGKPEHRYGPPGKFTSDDKILKGFIWKPKERPRSKEEIIHPKVSQPSPAAAKGKPPVKGKTGKGKTSDTKAVKDTAAPVKQAVEPPPPVKTAADSTAKPAENKMVKDSVSAKKDSSNIKKPVEKPAQ
ncbi:MAG TPA: OstA-like protein [Mucilaginibacter sp.]|nr:OstA-like protein [Mucilaginibacter sp.]